MKITVTHWLLIDSLKNLASVANSKLSTEVLRSCLVECEPDSITMHATDNEMAIRETIPAQCSETGKILINAGFLLSIVKELPASASVQLEAKGASLKVMGQAIKGLRMSVPLISEAAEFPVMEEPAGSAIVIDATALKTLFQNVIHAASTDAVKPVYNGIFLSGDNKTFSAVATDSRRLAVSSIPAEENPLPDDGIIIPLKAVHEIIKLLSSGSVQNNPIKLIFADSQLSFLIGRGSRIVFTTRLTHGQYPAYKNVIPAESAIEAVVDRSELMSAFQRASIFCVAPAFRTLVTINSKSGTIELSVQSDRGEFYEAVPSESAGTLKLGMNMKFLQDALGSISSRKITIKFNDSMSPVIITTDPKEGRAQTVNLIMPIQIKEESDDRPA